MYRKGAESWTVRSATWTGIFLEECPFSALQMGAEFYMLFFKIKILDPWAGPAHNFTEWRVSSPLFPQRWAHGCQPWHRLPSQRPCEQEMLRAARCCVSLWCVYAQGAAGRLWDSEAMQFVDFPVQSSKWLQFFPILRTRNYRCGWNRVWYVCNGNHGNCNTNIIEAQHIFAFQLPEKSLLYTFQGGKIDPTPG